MSRFGRERIPAPDYLRMTYYERWIAGLEVLLVERGLVTAEELASGAPTPGSAKAEPPLIAERVPGMLERRGSYQRDIAAPPCFAVGAAVRARNLNPVGHTRLPRYARGKRGLVTCWHGAHVFPDANALGQGEQPRHLYQVRFEALELWGETAQRREAVYLDLWEPYLDPA
ncbi:MAG TPA: nitrile hydratase subunit beta, partial [Caulobacteraceae bacterium]|nr:nitrile hydratase subunit beta [Caulobacteraceae bacterium]